jgi:hypothetical protein
LLIYNLSKSIYLSMSNIERRGLAKGWILNGKPAEKPKSYGFGDAKKEHVHKEKKKFKFNTSEESAVLEN